MAIWGIIVAVIMGIALENREKTKQGCGLWLLFAAFIYLPAIVLEIIGIKDSVGIYFLALIIEAASIAFIMWIYDKNKK